MEYRVDRVRERIDKLADRARTPEGGVTRLSYTPAYREGMELVQSFMKEAGMKVRIDPLGNIFGHFDGTDGSLPVVLTGSHLDSVPNGGKFDGALGLISAIECVNGWKDAGWKPRRPVEVIAMLEEEGTQFGIVMFASSVLTGRMKSEDPAKIVNAEGKSVADMLAGWGLDKNAFHAACLDPAKIRCFVELHIEQGERLHRGHLACGLVTDIVGIYRCWVTITGTANHAGTTRMDSRKDALVAASHIVEKSFEAALQSGDHYVATVGTMDIWPGAINIVPGRVSMPVEIRATTAAELNVAKEWLLAEFRGVEAKYGVKIDITRTSLAEPIHLDEQIVGVLRQAAQNAGVDYLEMPSWAGHDAQLLASIVPTAMIFVPSIEGISHSPQEDTRWEDIETGLHVYSRALMELASK
ncbi:MAG: Zn-dependent hydrolase [Candidatus Korobacteraceae bacterium]|jgi:allantoate deiminase/N-carbamoyl-L-amino-acid hydrolase